MFWTTWLGLTACAVIQKHVLAARSEAVVGVLSQFTLQLLQFC